MTSEKQFIREKRHARKLALQALYQWLMGGDLMSNIDAQFRVYNNMDKVDAEYYSRIIYGVEEHIADIEGRITPFLTIPLNELTPIERSILRLSAYELIFCWETHYRIILDEAVNLAKEFGTQDGYKFVNGVLHAFARTVRDSDV